MAKNLNKDATYKAAKPNEKDYTINDGEGLVMLVKVTGDKRWRFDYRINGKQNRLGFGIYPAVTLEAARGKADKAREDIEKGNDPAEIKKQSRKADMVDIENQRRKAYPLLGVLQI